jgi:ketosteroid isomerase-like protein
MSKDMFAFLYKILFKYETMINKFVLPIVIVFFITVSCNTKKNTNNSVNDSFSILDTDRSFSKLSEQKGIKFALIHFIDSKGTFLKPGNLPIVGGQAINYLSQMDDNSFTLTWEPKGGSVANSGELGYTFGVYSLKPNNEDTVLYGTYVSVWKKQTDGNWKFVLQSQNEGIE